MGEMTAGARAAERILEDRNVLARDITEALYRAKPELLEKHGEFGRGKCLEDMRYNLEHLAPAVDLGEPEMFASYVRWLDGLLRARNVATDDVVRCLELTESRLRDFLDPVEMDAVTPSIRAGLRVLSAEEVQ